MTEQLREKSEAAVDSPLGLIFLPQDKGQRIDDLILALTLKRDPYSWVETPEQQFAIYNQLRHARDRQLGNGAISIARCEAS